MKKQILLIPFLVAGAAFYGFFAKPVQAATLPLSASPIVVNSIADTSDASGGTGTCETSTPGECTLRAALETANVNANLSEQDHITFNISGTGVKTIAQTGAAYQVLEPVQIDGYTQTGAAENTNAWPDPLNGTLVVEINGTNSVAENACFNIASDEVTIKGLVINRCIADGLYLQANVDEVDILGNYFGTDPDGLLQQYSVGSVISAFLPNITNLTIGGSDPADRNLFASATRVTNISGDTVSIKGNYFGVGSDGVTTLPQPATVNSSTLYVAGSNVEIGGNGAGEGNTIDNNPNWGGIGLANTTNVSVLGNTITGNNRGIVIAGTAINVSIGDGTSGGRNVISGNDVPDQFDSLGNAIENTATSGSISIKGNYIGVADDGVTAFGNGFSGILVTGGANIEVGGSSAGDGNVIAANNGAGIEFGGATGVVSIKGNYIGVGSDGVTPLGNGLDGIAIEGSSDFEIGGITAAERNVIGDNGDQGIQTIGSDSLVSIKGNYIGVGSDGVTAVGNGSHGINVLNGASDYLIGGATSDERNIIADNVGDGIHISNHGGSSDISGNYIGLIADGSASLGNSGNGLAIINGTGDALIGGTTSSERNVIADNAEDGIHLASANGSTQVIGNYIGVESDGTTASGNGNDGIQLSGSSNEVLIGGLTSAEENIIANSTGSGITVRDDNTRAAILRNSIFDNDLLGIDIAAFADDLIGDVTPNDTLDPDSGPNDLLNFPQTEVEVDGSDSILYYQVDVPAGDYEVLFYENTTGDPSGHGEGESFIGSDTFTSAGNGMEEFNFTVTGNTFNNVSAMVTKVDVEDANGYSVSSEFGDGIIRERDVAVSQAVVDQYKITTDGYIEYDITYTNNGPDILDVTQFDADPGDPLNTALFNYIIPANLSFDSITGDASCVESNAANTFGTLFTDHSAYTVLSCAYNGVSPRDLAEDESLDFTIRLTATDPMVKVFNTYVLSVPLSEDLSVSDYSDAVSSGNDIITELGSTINNLDTVTTTAPVADMAITKTLVDPENYVPGGTVNYVIRLTNNGPAPVELSDYDGSGGNPLATALFSELMPPDMTLNTIITPNVTCPINVPAGLAPFFSNHADYSLITCNHADNVSNVLEEDEYFEISFTADLANDSELNYINYVFNDPGLAYDTDYSAYSAAFSTIVDAIDYSSENPYNNFAASNAPTDMALTMELTNPDEVIVGNTLHYNMTLTNNGPGDVDLTMYWTGNQAVATFIYDADNLTYVDANNNNINCSDLGPGSAAYLGPATEDHSSYSLITCYWTGDTQLLTAGQSFDFDANFIVDEGLQGPITNYALHIGTQYEEDAIELLTLIFTATGDVLDDEALVTNNNYAVLSSEASPIPETPDGENGGSSAGGGSSGDDLSGGLGDTGQYIFGIAGLALVVMMVSGGTALYLKRRNATRN